MQSLRSYAALVAVLVGSVVTAHSARAGDINKCKGSKGETIYQSAPCPVGSKVIGRGHFEPVPDDPHQVRAAAEEAERIRYERDAQAGIANANVSPNIDAPNSTTGTAATAGFSCSVNGRSWVQATPCPATSTRFQSEHLSGTILNTGEHVSGTATRRVTVPVESKALSKDELCDQLSSNPKVAERGADADSSYRRRQLRHSSGCR